MRKERSWFVWATALGPVWCYWHFWNVALHPGAGVESDAMTSFSMSASYFFIFLEPELLTFSWKLCSLACSFLTRGVNWALSVGYLGQIKSVVERVLSAGPQALWRAKWHRHLLQSSLNLFGIGKYFFNPSPAQPNQILAGRIKFKLASVLETKAMPFTSFFFF